MEIDNLLENTSIVSNDTINTIELEEFPKEGCCKTDQIELRDYLKNKFPQYIQKSWRSYYTIVAWNEIRYWWCEEKSSKPEYQLSQLQKFFTKEEVKQPLKQVVHCKTQEEWDFVLEKINYEFYHPFNVGYHDTIDFINRKESFKSYYKDHQILSFQEWCDLNGYKMKKEVAKTLIEPIKDEVKQSLKQVVHCTTQEEWDFVLSKLSKSSFLSEQSDRFTKYNDHYRHEGGIAVNINDCVYSGIGWYKNEGYQILSFQEWCNLNGYKMEKEVAKTLVEPIKEEAKQSLKQAVHCKTQEEINYIREKFGHSKSTNQFEFYGEVAYYLDTKGFDKINDVKCRKNYQILSFQEWCDLNRYKMEKKVEFEVGKWYSIKTAYNWIIKFKEIKDGNIRADWHCLNERGKKVEEGGHWESKPTEIKELSIEEIQQYLPEGHPNKIKTNIKFEVGDWVVNLENSISYNVNEICRVSKINKTHLACENKPQGEDSMKPFDKFRHATPEEIQQYLSEEHPDKIKSNQEFKVGDYVILENAGGWNYSPCNNGCLGLITKMSNYKPSTVDKYICSITGDILNSKNKDTKFNDVPVAFYEGKWIVRHATQEEINNHLISIGQIPAGEPLNTGIEPNKDGAFKYTTLTGSLWSGCTIQNHLEAIIPTTGNCYDKDFATSCISVKPKMILSIDDEELPMVNIIKTNTIKQLLNND